jgi:hypothetical protein
MCFTVAIPVQPARRFFIQAEESDAVNGHEHFERHDSVRKSRPLHGQRKMAILESRPAAQPDRSSAF